MALPMLQLLLEWWFLICLATGGYCKCSDEIPAAPGAPSGVLHSSVAFDHVMCGCANVSHGMHAPLALAYVKLSQAAPSCLQVKQRSMVRPCQTVT